MVDPRAAGVLGDADAAVGGLWSRAAHVAAADVPGMGLTAGERPAADVEVLCSAVAIVEFELARRMHAAARSGSLPLVGAGAMLLARGWSSGWARRLAGAGEFADQHPPLGAVWAAGIITSEHVWALARHADRLSTEEMAGVIDELAGLWGQLSPRAVGVFVGRVIRMLRPPQDPEPGEWQAHEARHLSFALTGDSVILSGSLPRLEGEAVMAAIDAFADRLRSQADHVPASARRADGLVALVSAAHAAGGLPTRGGLPVSVSVTVETTANGDEQCHTSRGHTLTAAEQRFASCDALVTPVLVGTNIQYSGPDERGHGQQGNAGLGSTGLGNAPQGQEQQGAADGEYGRQYGRGPDRKPAAVERIRALAETLLGARVPLAVGRTARTATSAQRRALAARDRGCIVPGCGVPAEACQTHHLREWASGGRTDIENLVLVCWSHHRQVDLAMWSISPAVPDAPVAPPAPGSPAGEPWPANNGAPWIVTRLPRTRWRT